MTGASGWLGRTACELLAAAGVPTYGYASFAREGIFDLREIGPPPPGSGPVLLLHLACLTKDRLDALGFEQYVTTNVAISSRMLDWIAEFRPDGIFIASSGAAAADRPIEDDPYGALKRLDELAFGAAARAAAARLRIARVYNVAGRHITKPELYALGDLVQSVLRDEPLRIRASGDVLRSYVAVDDLIELVLAELIAPDRPEQLLFETGSGTVEIGDLAQAVRAALGRSDLPIERSRDPDATTSDYRGDGTVMSNLLEYHGITPTSLEDQIRQTAESLK